MSDSLRSEQLNISFQKGLQQLMDKQDALQDNPISPGDPVWEQDRQEELAQLVKTQSEIAAQMGDLMKKVSQNIGAS